MQVQPRTAIERTLADLSPGKGFLRSGGGTRTHDKRINSPLLCQTELPRKVPVEVTGGAQDTRGHRQSSCRVTPRPYVGESSTMKFRTGLVIGLGVGFILGARAGRERYDQLMGSMESLRANEKVQRATAIADRSTAKVRRAAGSGLVMASETIKERAENNGSGTAQ